jgi:NAD(P)-dependent dehydrogenase (short-subunit alcohol dehydrogenase family)
MARVFVTGSSTGLGLMAGELLVEQGHRVVLHARNPARADDARRALPQAEAVVQGDLSSVGGARGVAEQANALGRFDAVIHNAGVFDKGARPILNADGVPHVFAVNVLAAYILTALIERPGRLVYLSSGLHRGASARLDDLTWKSRAWNGSAAYAESKLFDALIAFGVARRWPDVLSNALEPGWVATRMGGANAPDDMDQGRRTQVWLAVSDAPEARVTGRYFRFQRERAPDPQTASVELQDRLLAECGRLSGVALPD